MKKKSPENRPLPLVVFAQVPPPEHGQSRMVRLALEALRAREDSFEVHHINARFSETLEDIGEGSFRKGFLIASYLLQAILLRFKLTQPVLYYVPGPAKWSAVIRDWFVLAILRLCYPKVVFHWHAIGQGEWANGSERVSLSCPTWLDKVARKISRFVLEEPYASIAVSEESGRDSATIASRQSFVVCNGIEDPCPDYASKLKGEREKTWEDLKNAKKPLLKLLFLSHGTEEKGLFVALNAVAHVLEAGDPSWHFEFTLAGGVRSSLLVRFEGEYEKLRDLGGTRLKLQVLDYLGESEKSAAFAEHDLFLSASCWESFGITTVEAMAHGMIVIAVGSDGVKGVLSPDHPYLTQPGDDKAYASSLLQGCLDLTTGKRTTDHLGAALRERFLARYQLRDFASNISAILLQVGMPRFEFPKKDDSLIPISVYLADQNPGYDRSFGISRMSQMVIKALNNTGHFEITAVVSRTSQKAPEGVGRSHFLPWGTRSKVPRFLTDHFHLFWKFWANSKVIRYYPKGYLPLVNLGRSPTVVTIHDTIIQYGKDHYPEWRNRIEYGYWAMMLKHTLRSADLILTVSESAKNQILTFMERHEIPEKKIIVTYEPCVYDELPQPVAPPKQNYVIHLASVEPHKGSARLVRWWAEQDLNLPDLHLVGSLPDEIKEIVAKTERIVKRPFLSDEELKNAYKAARALILPSEIEGFGLPALEAYYLGTPVCFVRGTSVDEILGVATIKGGVDLANYDSLREALSEVLAMTSLEVEQCGRKLREVYSLKAVSQRMLEIFRRASRLS